MAFGNKNESESVNALLKKLFSGLLTRAIDSNQSSCSTQKDFLKGKICNSRAPISFSMNPKCMLNWCENQKEKNSFKPPKNWHFDVD